MQRRQPGDPRVLRLCKPRPTDAITRKEIDIRGARTSAGEFEEAIELIYTKKVDVQKILTKVISIDEVPDTIVDIEKNPGDYMKVVVMIWQRAPGSQFYTK